MPCKYGTMYGSGVKDRAMTRRTGAMRTLGGVILLGVAGGIYLLLARIFILSRFNIGALILAFVGLVLIVRGLYTVLTGKSLGDDITKENVALDETLRKLKEHTGNKGRKC